MTDITYPLFPIASALGFVVVLIPLPWHLEAWNSGTCYYMIWTALACLNQLINSVVWANDAINRAPVWCDISTRIILGASVGIPASSMCIMRRLYNITKVQAVTSTRAEKRRALLVDTLICVLFPIIELVLAYVVQGHRFDIFEQVGCYPHIVNMLPAYFLVVMWPIVLGLISAIYCGLTLWSFLQRKAQFSQFMSSNSSLTMSRYLRLMALAGVELLCTTPLSVFLMALNLSAQPLDPWVSWDDTHSNFSRVGLFPAVLWTLNRWLVVGIQVNRWSGPFCAFIFFAFFGFASEARRNYLKAISRVLAFCKLNRDPPSEKASPGLRKLTLASSSASSSSLPAFTSPPPRYQPPNIVTTPSSPEDKGFAPLASAGTVSEFTVSAYEKPLDPETLIPQMFARSLSSSASSTSLVDYVV